MSKCLRHDGNLPTNAKGFAWIDDVAFAIWSDFRKYRVQRLPTAPEILYCVSVESTERFQCVMLQNSETKYSGLVRAVQGHSGPIRGRIDNQEAFMLVVNPQVLVHYTNQNWIYDIIGPESVGLIPGGSLCVGALLSFPRLTARCRTGSENAAPPPPSSWTSR